MSNTKTPIVKKSLVVIAALIVGFVMPYLSRIPLAFTYGTAWIWSYMDTADDFMRWNGFHIASLIPIVIFGFVCLYENTEWAFRASVFGHYAATAFIYYNFGEHYSPDDFLGCIIFPFLFGGASVLCGAIALVVELVAANRKQKMPQKSEKVYG